jgi:hypothetical protein
MSVPIMIINLQDKKPVISDAYLISKGPKELNQYIYSEVYTKNMRRVLTGKCHFRMGPVQFIDQRRSGIPGRIDCPAEKKSRGPVRYSA